MKDGDFQFAEMKEAVGTLMTPEMATRARKAIETCKAPGRCKNCQMIKQKCSKKLTKN
jgi:hypothetical protein